MEEVSVEGLSNGGLSLCCRSCMIVAGGRFSVSLLLGCASAATGPKKTA